MIKTSFKSAWARKRRLTGTFIAVFLGVAFLTGTLALGDTLGANFQTLFSSVTRGTDAVVRSSTTVSSDRSRATRAPIDGSVARTVGRVDGVAEVQPSVEGYGALIGRDGKTLGGNGPPRLAGNWITDPDLNPYRLVEGRAPQAADEVVINKGAATKGNLHVGDMTTVRTPDPVAVHVVGIATFGSEDGFGSATFTAFTLPAAEQRLIAEPGMVSSILVKGAPGVSQADVVRNVERVLPASDQAVTGAQLTKENTDDINRIFLNFLRTFLVVFAGIALLVATFSIYNTFSIIAAQRSRESALLRAVGATRAQVLGSVLLESAAVGVVASIAGLLGGIGVAGLLKGMFDAFGFNLPAGGLVFKTSTVVIGVAVGTLVTLVAGLAPALRASRVRPVAAMRDAAAEPAHITAGRTVAGAVVTAAGVATVLAAVVGDGANVLAWAGLG